MTQSTQHGLSRRTVLTASAALGAGIAVRQLPAVNALFPLIHESNKSSVPAAIEPQFFINPPDSTRLSVWWLWLNDIVTKESLTQDLEAFKAQGIRSVTVYSINGAWKAPVPPVPAFMGTHWRELFRHVINEGNRLGMTVDLNLGSGWNAGGPWVTPENACKQYVSAEMSVQGPMRFSGRLPQPLVVGGYYCDVAIQAFRALPENRLTVTASSFRQSDPPENTIDRSDPGEESQSFVLLGSYPPVNVIDGNSFTFWSSRGNKPGEAPTPLTPEWLEFEFERPIRADRLLLVPRPRGFGPKDIEVQSSQDGSEWKSLTASTLGDDTDTVVSFPETTSQFFRILILSSHSAVNVQVAQAVIYSHADPVAAQKQLLAIKAARAGAIKRGLGTPETTIAHLCELPLEKLSSIPDQPVIDAAEIVDLTTELRADGTLEWDVPPGHWTILRTGHTLTGMHTHWSAPGGGGFEIDTMRAAAMDTQFDMIVNKLVRDVGPAADGAFRTVQIDSWEIEMPNWTQDFMAEFRHFRGYDAQPYLPALSGRIVTSTDVTDRFLYDYRKTVADCIAANYYGRLTQLAHTRNLLHRSEAGGLCYPVLPPINCLANLGRCDIPQGEFWQNDNFTENGQNVNGKQTAAAAHIYGSRIVAGEAFTGGPPWGYYPAVLKPTADRAFCEGFNQFWVSHAPAVRPGYGKPGYAFSKTNFNRNLTWWPEAGAFSDYIGRCQYMLQQGLFVADVLYYGGDWAPNYIPPKHVDPALGQGYDYDVCDVEVLLNRLSVKDGRLVLPDGMNYRVLVLPNSHTMPPEVLNKIEKLTTDGATVIGPPPEGSPGLKNYPQGDDAMQTLASRMWGGCDGKKITETRHGAGRIVWGKNIRDVLQQDGLLPDFECVGNDADTFIDYIHRATPTTDIYFLANRRNQPEKVQCNFRVTGRQPEIWDPVTAEVHAANAYAIEGDRTTISLEFAPYGSLFLVFHTPTIVKKGTEASNFRTWTPVQMLEGPWTVHFDPSWGGPATVKFPTLKNWAICTDPGIKYYSGTATYITEFDVPRTLEGKKMALDLGAVEIIARVKLNGHDLGILWTNFFRTDVTGLLRRSGNILEVSITNQWQNRLIGDALLPPAKRLTHTNAELSAKSPLLNSGLLGPVWILEA